MKPSEQPKESPGWAANPNYLIDWDLVPAKVSASFNGEVVAESDQVRVMYELGHAPIYYFPKSALNPQFFETGDGPSHLLSLQGCRQLHDADGR